jgi:hypothetical protein
MPRTSYTDVRAACPERRIPALKRGTTCRVTAGPTRQSGCNVRFGQSPNTNFATMFFCTSFVPPAIDDAR